MKRILYFALFTTAFFVGFELLLALPSHPDCGTAAIDYMPCDYLPRIGWDLENGSWLVPAACLAAFNIGYAANIIAKRKAK